MLMGSSLCKVPHCSWVVSAANGTGPVHWKLLPVLWTGVVIVQVVVLASELWIVVAQR